MTKHVPRTRDGVSITAGMTVYRVGKLKVLTDTVHTVFADSVWLTRPFGFISSSYPVDILYATWTNAQNARLTTKPPDPLAAAQPCEANKMEDQS